MIRIHGLSPQRLRALCMAASTRKAEAERSGRKLEPICWNSVLDPPFAHSMIEYCPKVFMR